MSMKNSVLTAESVIVKDAEEPSVTSEDPNERKLARRQRIQRRAIAIKLQAIKEAGNYVEEEKEPVEIQMEKSTGILKTFLIESQEYLENVRVANEFRESNRRESEGIGREKVLSRLEAEAVEAQKLFNEIAGKWAGIHDYKDPLHIHEDILLQKMKCDELIKRKDELIETLKGEIRLAERKFSSDQVKQNQDIAILGTRIEKQINFIKKAYNTEFNLIDQVISEEKRKFINKSNEKWDDLYLKRNQEEIALSEYRFRKQEEMANKVQHLTVCYEEQFRKTKIELERDIENAQNEFERIKSMALSNRERLDYNYDVLKRREYENLIIKSQQKRRMSKLQDAISELKISRTNYREKTSKQIKKTKNDIERLRKNIIEIDSKADLFALTNEKKFNDVWKLNSTHCYDLLDRIVKIDQILHEQQMGVKWTRPVIHKIEKSTIDHRSSSVIKNKSSVMLKPSTSTAGITKTPHPDDNLNPNYRKLLKHILKALGNKSGFLTEKCIKLLINTYEDDQQSLVTLANVFFSLGIRKSEDIDTMVDFFLPYCFCQECFENLSSHSSFAPTTLTSRHMSVVSYMSKTSFLKSSYYSPSIIDMEHTWDGVQQSDDLVNHIVQELVRKESLVDEFGYLKVTDVDSEEDVHIDIYSSDKLPRRRTLKVDMEKMSCKYNHLLVISTVYVLAALKDFVINYYKQTEISPTIAERLSKRRYTTSRLMEDDEIKNHWMHLRSTFRQSNIFVWEGLREGLLKYLEILKDRKTVSEDVMRLRKKNKALKRLLASYMDHGEFMKPICAIQTEIPTRCSQTAQDNITNK